MATANEKIISYYLLCTIQQGGKSHMINELSDDKLSVILTKKEVKLYLRKQDDAYVAREIVVGGAQPNTQQYERLPVIII